MNGPEDVPDVYLSEYDGDQLVGGDEARGRLAEIRIAMDLLSEMEELTADLIDDEITYREFMTSMNELEESESNDFLR